MDTNNIDGATFENTIGKVLCAVDGLRARYSATDDGNVSLIKTYREFEMICNVAQPTLSSGNW